MSGGYLYGEEEPTEHCPYCTTVCHADFVDVGVGMVQCGPYHCEGCGASEQGAYDAERELTEDEKRTGWYAPDSEPGSSANVIGGQVVGYREMTDLYKATFTGNPAYEEPGYVEDWFERVRRP